MNVKSIMSFAALFAIAGAAPAMGQSSVEGDIKEQLLNCDEVTDLAQRLVCFDAIVDALKATVPLAKSTAAPQKVPAAIPENNSAPESTPPEPSSATVADDFGRDSMRSKSDKGEEESTENANAVVEMEATIVRSWKNNDGRFSVELDGGQIWRETQGSRITRLPAVGASVRIKPGRWSGYRMKIDKISKAAWVRRVK